MQKACLGQQQDSGFLHHLPNVKSLFIEALTGFSRIYHTTSLSQGCVVGAASGSRKGQQNPHSKDREGMGAFECPGSTGSHVFLMAFLNSFQDRFVCVCTCVFGLVFNVLLVPREMRF